MERVTRIELAYSAWKADVLPLNYTRNGRENRIRTCDILVPNQALYQAELFPELYIIKLMARQTGLEPVAFWSVAKRSIQLSYWRIFKMAVSTGLEPAISSVTDWHVNHYTTRPYLHNALILYHFFGKYNRQEELSIDI